MYISELANIVIAFRSLRHGIRPSSNYTYYNRFAN